MIRNDIHPKLKYVITYFLTISSHPYILYGEFSTHINFHESHQIPTCAVNVSEEGMNFYYNSHFLDKLSNEECVFVFIHEMHHLLYKHHDRFNINYHDKKIANYAMDMVINHLIIELYDINIKPIKNALFIPKKYNGDIQFELVYEFLIKELEQKKDLGEEYQSGDSGDGKNAFNPKYSKMLDNGKYIKSPSLNDILDSISNDTDYCFDSHINDTVCSSERDSIIEDFLNDCRSRGTITNEINIIISKINKSRTDYLKFIKSSITTNIIGNNKYNTITRPNRKVKGLMGYKRKSMTINVIIDMSGSMFRESIIKNILSYINRNDIIMNIILNDTTIKGVIKNIDYKSLLKIDLKGGGGTIMQPSIDYIVSNFNNFNTVMFTDGYTDYLDLSKVKGRFLIVSIDSEAPICKSNGKLKQIVIK